MLAGSLALLIELVAAGTGKVLRAFIVGASVFIIGALYIKSIVHAIRNSMNDTYYSLLLLFPVDI